MSLPKKGSRPLEYNGKEYRWMVGKPRQEKSHNGVECNLADLIVETPEGKVYSKPMLLSVERGLVDPITTRDVIKFIDAAKLIEASRIQPLVLTRGNQHRVILPLINDTDRELHFNGRLFHHHSVQYDSTAFDAVVPPRGTEHIVINASSELTRDSIPPMEMHWKLGFPTGFM